MGPAIIILCLILADLCKAYWADGDPTPHKEELEEIAMLFLVACSLVVATLILSCFLCGPALGMISSWVPFVLLFIIFRIAAISVKINLPA